MRRLALFACAIVLASGLGSCSSDSTAVAHLVAPGFRGAGVAYPNAKAGVPYTVGDLIICLDRQGKATIDSVEMIKPTGGLHIDDFAVIPNRMESGQDGFEDDNTPISRLAPKPSHPVVVTRACPASWNAPPTANPQSVALLLQYSKPSSKSAAESGIAVHYTSSGHKETLSLTWTLGLCEKETKQNGTCPMNG
jgi:hypothetical protein